MPVVGWLILAYDVSRIGVESVVAYNKIALVRKHYGSIISGRAPVITPGSDIDADIGMDWAEAEGLMEDFFEKFSVDKASFNIKTYYPDPPMGTLLKNLFRREKDLPEVPPFTVNMLIESAKSGRWLF